MLKQFGVRKNFGYRKKFCIGGYHDFLSKKFCLTVPKNFVGEPFCVLKKMWYRKILCTRGGGIKVLSKILFHRTEKLRERPLVCFRNFLVWKKLWIRDGEGISFFPLKIFCLTVPQNFVRIINVSENFGYRKILRIRRGCHCSTLNFFCLTGAKKSVFRENSGIENFHA